MRRGDLFDSNGLCVNCGHLDKVHTPAVGSDGGQRVFCFGCPPTINRMIGDEGVDSPMPYVLEGPLGLSKPCFENKPVRNKTPKILPLSPGLQGDGGVRFHGLALPLDTLVQIQNGEVATDRRTLKVILYGEQMGRCAGCGDATRFHNLEMDRIIPGSSGGCYIVGNVQLLCGWCNRTKGDRPMEYLQQRMRDRTGKVDGTATEQIF